MGNLLSTKWQQLKLNLSGINSINLLKEARTRIILVYSLLMVFMVITAVPVIQTLVYQRVRNRVVADLEQDLEKFENEFIKSLLNYKLDSNDRELTENVIGEQKVYEPIPLIRFYSSTYESSLRIKNLQNLLFFFPI